MTGKELAKLAEAAFGKRWKYTVRDKLKVSREMLWRYETGQTPISDDLNDRFRKLFKPQIERNRDALTALLKTL